MTIDRQYGNIIFICDVATSPKCEGQIETDEADFTVAYNMARGEGWGAVPLTSGTGWMHFCGNCPRPR